MLPFLAPAHHTIFPFSTWVSCPSYSRRRGRIDLGLLRSLYKWGLGWVGSRPLPGGVCTATAPFPAGHDCTRATRMTGHKACRTVDSPTPSGSVQEPCLCVYWRAQWVCGMCGRHVRSHGQALTGGCFLPPPLPSPPLRGRVRWFSVVGERRRLLGRTPSSSPGTHSSCLVIAWAVQLAVWSNSFAHQGLCTARRHRTGAAPWDTGAPALGCWGPHPSAKPGPQAAGSRHRPV